jgi:hypothetical protein
MKELFEINNLMYETPIDISAVANSTLNTYNFAPNSYENSNGGEIMQVEFQEGLDFVDGNDSYIRLKLRVNTNNPAGFPFFSFSRNSQTYFSSNSGASVLNLIRSVELVSKDGNTFFREDLKNQLQCLREYKINEARKNYLGIMGCISQNSSQGIGITYPSQLPYNDQINGFPIFPTNKEVSFIIPLSEISPYFSTTQLIHPKFLAGSILRLTLENPFVALQILNLQRETVFFTDPLTYNFSNMAVILSEKELYKEVEDKITHQMKTKGLNYAYYQSLNTVFNIPSQDYTNESFVFPINLSAAKIKYLAVKPMYLTNLTEGQKFNSYPMASISAWQHFAKTDPSPEDCNDAEFSMRIRLGNKVYPENYQISKIPDFYNITTYALNNISFSSCEDVDIYKIKNKQSPCCVGGDFYAYKNLLIQTPDFNGTSGGLVWALDFERSQAVSNGGLSTNQERLLSLEINNYNQTQNDDRAISLIVSVQFLTVATLFEDGKIAVNK